MIVATAPHILKIIQSDESADTNTALYSARADALLALAEALPN